MTLKELTRVYRRFDMECASLSGRLRSARDYEPVLFIPTQSAREEVEGALRSLLDRSLALPAPDPVFAILKAHFGEYLRGLMSSLNSKFAQPRQFIDEITRFLGFIARKDSRFAEERTYILERRLGQVDELWSAVRLLLPSLSAGKVKELARSCETLVMIAKLNADRVKTDYAGLPDTALERLVAALKDLAGKAAAWREECMIAAEVLSPSGPVGDSSEAGQAAGENAPSGHGETSPKESYETVLAEERGVELADLLRWYDDEVEKTREEIFDIAEAIDLGRERIPRTVQGVVEGLNKYAGPAANAEEMFARCRDYLARAREAIRGYVNLPEEVCRVVAMEEEGRAHNPWGGYRGGCPRRRPLVGEMVLNPDNVPAITDGWIKINAVHESYPGHHVQFVRTTVDPLPATVKEGARSTPLVEGTCLRSERVFEFAFPEDPFYPLFVAYRRHHTATRIKADLYLHYFGRSVGDAVQLYMDELAFDRQTARGQVLAQELQPGYFTTYYYGLKKLTELQERFGYDDKSYTEVLFTPGRLSLKNFEAFLALSEADKKRFLTEFASMMEY